MSVWSRALFCGYGQRSPLLDIDHQRIEGLKNGVMPTFMNPARTAGAPERKIRRVILHHRQRRGSEGADFAFVAVGTPSGDEGELT